MTTEAFTKNITEKVSAFDASVTLGPRYILLEGDDPADGKRMYFGLQPVTLDSARAYALLLRKAARRLEAIAEMLPTKEELADGKEKEPNPRLLERLKSGKPVL